MLKYFSLFFCCGALCADTFSIPAYSSVYSIDVSLRGSAIVNMYNSVYSSNNKLSGSQNFAIGMQTTAGFLAPIRSIVPMPNNTILIVNYGTTVTALSVQKTAVVFVEQIGELVYNDQQFLLGASGFTLTAPSNTVPYFFINPIQRAQDIQSVFQTLTKSAYKSSSRANSQMAIQTTLNGNFYGNIANGNIVNVNAVSVVENGMLLVGYPVYPTPPAYAQYVIVAPEQVTGIIYTPNP